MLFPPPGHLLRRLAPACAVSVVSVTVLGGFSCVAPRGSSLPEGYELQTTTWRATRLESIGGPDGWVTLVGLHWLEEGKSYKVGADPGNDLLLPEGHASGRLGRLSVGRGSARLDVEPGASAAVEGRQVTSVELRSDREGTPTVVSSGSVTLRLLDRSGRLALRVKDANSPARAAFRGLNYFPIDPDLRVEATLEPAARGRTVELANILGLTEALGTLGTLRFILAGRSCSLEATVEAGAKDFFLIFRDATSGRETYASGRFLRAALPDTSGRTILDFNQAYNPPCAFTPFATCPLPPPQNVLQVPVRAGELKYEAAR